MSRSTRVTVEGLDDLRATLDALPAKVQAAAEEAVKAEVDAVADDMRSAAPVDTGTLVESIHAEVTGLAGAATATARHAVFVEFGTSSTPAQPFAGPAAELSRGRFPRRVREAIRGAIGGPA